MNETRRKKKRFVTMPYNKYARVYLSIRAVFGA